MKILKRTNGLGEVFDTENTQHSIISKEKPDPDKSLHLNHHTNYFSFLCQFFPEGHPIFIRFEESFYYLVETTKPMEISKSQQIERVCNAVMMITSHETRTWDDVAKNAYLIIHGMQLEIRTRDVLENWPYLVGGKFDLSKYPYIDKTGLSVNSKEFTKDYLKSQLLGLEVA